MTHADRDASESAERYWRTIGADLPIEERRERIRRATTPASDATEPGYVDPFANLRADLAHVRERNQAAWDEIRRLRQGLWDVWAVLGHDTDGDTGPEAFIAGMGIDGLIRMVVEDARTWRRESEEDYDKDTMRLERKLADAIGERDSVMVELKANVRALADERARWKVSDAALREATERAEAAEAQVAELRRIVMQGGQDAASVRREAIAALAGDA